MRDPRQPVSWKDARFQPAIDAVRAAVGVTERDREDDPMIGMLLDRFSWDHDKVVERYKTSLARREELGLAKVKADIVDGGLGLDRLPHAAEVGRVIKINGCSSLERPERGAATGDQEGVLVNGKRVAFGDVIGCYEMRYGHSAVVAAAAEPPAAVAPEAPAPAPAAVAAPEALPASARSGAQTARSGAEKVSPQQFTEYMVYVTQWRWLQCEDYIRLHGELGFWSMIHDLSCPAGYISLWSRMRSLLKQCGAGRTHHRAEPPARSARNPCSAAPLLTAAARRSRCVQVHAARGGGVRRALPSDGAEDPRHQRAAHLRPGLVGHLGLPAAAPQGPHRAPHHLADQRRGGGALRAAAAHAAAPQGGPPGRRRLRGG